MVPRGIPCFRAALVCFLTAHEGLAGVVAGYRVGPGGHGAKLVVDVLHACIHQCGLSTPLPLPSPPSSTSPSCIHLCGLSPPTPLQYHCQHCRCGILLLDHQHHCCHHNHQCRLCQHHHCHCGHPPSRPHPHHHHILILITIIIKSSSSSPPPPSLSQTPPSSLPPLSLWASGGPSSIRTKTSVPGSSSRACAASAEAAPCG